MLSFNIPIRRVPKNDCRREGGIMLTGRRDLYVVRIDPWSALRIAVVIVDLHRPRAACLGREGVEEEVWRKVMREWMEWEEEGSKVSLL